MKFFSMLLCAFAYCTASTANVFGGLTVTETFSRVYANTFADTSGAQFLGGFELTDSNNLNTPFTDTRTITSGDRTYTYTYNASNTLSTIGSQIQLSTLASMNLSALVPGGGTNFDAVYTTIRFKVDQEYLATVNFDFSRPGMLPPHFEKIELFNGGVGAAYQLTSINGSEFPFGDKTASFILPPGEYLMGANFQRAMDSPFDLQNYLVTSSTVLTLTPSAVPEPSSMILMSCAAAFGLKKLRRKLAARAS